MNFIGWLALSFLAGSFPTAYLAGKWFRNVDIREVGSHNVGATNAFRVLGKKIGAVVFLIDFLKGFFPVYWAPSVPEVFPIVCGAGAILGHVFTPFLNFRGGKGVATGGGVLFAFSPLLFLIGISVWALTFSLVRIVAIGSMVAGGTVAFSAFFIPLSMAHRLFFMLIFLFLLWTHRSNISRLLK